MVLKKMIMNSSRNRISPTNSGTTHPNLIFFSRQDKIQRRYKSKIDNNAVKKKFDSTSLMFATIQTVHDISHAKRKKNLHCRTG
jgi:hypothetical protein